ncbi:MAG: N-acetyltransferase [Oxalobacter sp.]|nr:MAG: N-acetyltransferase [Oxalobacter sp.]
MRFVYCTYERHASRILDIFNEVIVNSTALFDYQPRSPESMIGWFAAKQQHQFPVVGYEDERGHLLGFATYGRFRAWPAYKYTVEHSIYIHQDHRGKGIGHQLLQELIKEAQRQQYHVMIGGIEATNTGSIALHEALGFTHAGTINQAGYKFGRWLDLRFYQLILPTPQHPTED